MDLLSEPRFRQEDSDRIRALCRRIIGKRDRFRFMAVCRAYVVLRYYDESSRAAIKQARELCFSRATVYNWVKWESLEPWLCLMEDELNDQSTTLGQVRNTRVLASKDDWKWMAREVFKEERRRARVGAVGRFGFRAKAEVIRASARKTGDRRHLAGIGHMNLYRNRVLLVGFVSRLWDEEDDLPSMDEVVDRRRVTETQRFSDEASRRWGKEMSRLEEETKKKRRPRRRKSEHSAAQQDIWRQQRDLCREEVKRSQGYDFPQLEPNGDDESMF